MAFLTRRVSAFYFLFGGVFRAFKVDYERRDRVKRQQAVLVFPRRFLRERVCVLGSVAFKPVYFEINGRVPLPDRFFYTREYMWVLGGFSES